MYLDYYVYELHYPKGKPFYVGKGRGNRLATHEWNALKGKKTHLYNKIRKIWRMRHQFTAVKIAVDLSNEQACQIERELIARYGRACAGGVLINQTIGGDGAEGHRHDLVSLAKMRAAWVKRSRVVSEDTRKKMRESMMGHTVSQETREKISSKLLGERHWNFGKKLPAWQAELLRNTRSRPIIAHGVRYESIAATARALGTVGSTISYRLKTRPTEYRYERP